MVELITVFIGAIVSGAISWLVSRDTARKQHVQQLKINQLEAKIRETEQKLQADLEAQVHVSKAWFDKEIGIYEKLWPLFCEVQDLYYQIVGYNLDDSDVADEYVYGLLENISVPIASLLEKLETDKEHLKALYFSLESEEFEKEILRFGYESVDEAIKDMGLHSENQALDEFDQEMINSLRKVSQNSGIVQKYFAYHQAVENLLYEAAVMKPFIPVEVANVFSDAFWFFRQAVSVEALKRKISVEDKEQFSNEIDKIALTINERLQNLSVS